jgi:3-hydroxymyristoyl/3-hydroxydecanoyl-(acyl carrier protein) dehydratase
MADRLPRILAIRPRQDGVELDLVVQPELLWFQGHFPELPILPGVVQLDWAVHFAHEQGVIEAPAARAFQVKFRAVVTPRDALTLVLQRQAKGGRVAFEFRRGDAVCSSGQLFAGEP